MSFRIQEQVGLIYVKIAKATGARVIVLTTSEAKRGLLEKLDADHVVNSKTNPGWADEVISLTSGRGADHVLEVIGAASIKESLHAVRQAGLISLVGFLSPSEKHDIIPDLVFGAKTSKCACVIKWALALLLFRPHPLASSPLFEPYRTLKVTPLTYCLLVRGLMNGSLGMLQDMAEFIERKNIHPVIAEVYEWHDAKEAYKTMLKQSFVGKIVIKATVA